MNRQYFQAPVGQVAAGNIYNQARWEPLSNEELIKISRDYKRQRRGAVLREWFNVYSLVILVLCIALGFWGTHLLKINGLIGDAATFNMAIVGVFAAAIAVMGWKLSVLRTEAKNTIAEIDSELKEISSLLRFRKSKR
jgi:hypothetical protein